MIWAPPKRRAIAPRCPRCGGLRRRPSRWEVRRWGAAGAVGAACCCGSKSCTEASEAQVDLSGVDAAICTGCYSNGTNYTKHESLSGVDGSYTVETGSGGTAFAPCRDDGCEFGEEWPDEVTYVQQLYLDSECTDQQGDPVTSNTLRIEVSLCDEDPARIASVLVEARKSDDLAAFLFKFEADDRASAPEIGETVSNELTCGDLNASSGGQATVTLP